MWQVTGRARSLGSSPPELRASGEAVLSELKWTDQCSLHGWHVATGRCKVPSSRRKCWNWRKTWWVASAKVIHHKLFQKWLDDLTCSVSKGTGTPRQEKACASKSSSVPRIAKWKCGNRLLIILILVLFILTSCYFKLCSLIIICNTRFF